MLRARGGTVGSGGALGDGGAVVCHGGSSRLLCCTAVVDVGLVADTESRAGHGGGRSRLNSSEVETCRLRGSRDKSGESRQDSESELHVADLSECVGSECECQK